VANDTKCVVSAQEVSLPLSSTALSVVLALSGSGPAPSGAVTKPEELEELLA
jgi:ABC-type proline/glycine betaine transport system ATPase subunit